MPSNKIPPTIYIFVKKGKCALCLRSIKKSFVAKLITCCAYKRKEKQTLVGWYKHLKWASTLKRENAKYWMGSHPLVLNSSNTANQEHWRRGCVWNFRSLGISILAIIIIRYKITYYSIMRTPALIISGCFQNMLFFLVQANHWAAENNIFWNISFRLTAWTCNLLVFVTEASYLTRCLQQSQQWNLTLFHKIFLKSKYFFTGYTWLWKLPGQMRIGVSTFCNLTRMPEAITDITSVNWLAKSFSHEAKFSNRLSMRTQKLKQRPGYSWLCRIIDLTHLIYSTLT